MRRSYVLVFAALVSPVVVVGAVASCGGDDPAAASAASTGATTSSGTGGSSPHDSGPEPSDVVLDAPVIDAGSLCSLPGSVQFTEHGIAVVPGAPDGTPDLTFLRMPAGFCAHHYAQVKSARQIRFAPGGELFVASPTTPTTGGVAGGLAQIVVIPDDDHDGFGDTPIAFLKNLPSTQGILFANDSFYFQDGTRIMKMPYASGDRHPSAAAQVAADITFYTSSIHWPKVLDQGDDGTIYVGNGGDDGEPCMTGPRAVHGSVLKLNPAGGTTTVAKGLRNPIAIRCSHGAHGQCFGIELAKDYSNENGGPGREKMFPIRQGDDWGFPCCATKGKPYQGVPAGVDCSTTVTENEGFFIGLTPFGLAFEPGNWPAPYTGRAFVVLHGIVGSWVGERMVSIEMDPQTGLPVPGNDIPDGSSLGGMHDFALGWEMPPLAHGRPAALEFAADGRLFVANDNDGEIFWIAPL